MSSVFPIRIQPQKLGLSSEFKAAPETNTRPANSKAVEKLFLELDRGNMGKLTKHDVLLLLRAASRSKTQSDDQKQRQRADDIMKKADKDRDGMLSLSEFSWWVDNDSFAVNLAKNKDFSSINKTVLELKLSEAKNEKKLESIWDKYKDHHENHKNSPTKPGAAAAGRQEHDDDDHKNNHHQEEDGAAAAGGGGADDEDVEERLEENLGVFLKAIHLDPDGPESFAFAYEIGHKHAGPVFRHQFINGLRNQDVDSWESLLVWAKRLRIRIKDEPLLYYRGLYMWIFDYIKEEPTRRTIPKEYAQHLWRVMLSPPSVSWPLYPLWESFIETQYESTVVKRDLWNCLYDFAMETNSKDASSLLSSYDRDSGAWPVVIDEFVDYAQQQQQQQQQQEQQ